MPSLSPLLSLAPLQPCQELEKGTDAAGGVVRFAGELSAGAVVAPLLPGQLLHATGVGETKWPGAGGSVGPSPSVGLKQL